MLNKDEMKKYIDIKNRFFKTYSSFWEIIPHCEFRMNWDLCKLQLEDDTSYRSHKKCNANTCPILWEDEKSLSNIIYKSKK